MSNIPRWWNSSVPKTTSWLLSELEVGSRKQTRFQFRGQRFEEKITAKVLGCSKAGEDVPLLWHRNGHIRKPLPFDQVQEILKAWATLHVEESTNLIGVTMVNCQEVTELLTAGELLSALAKCLQARTAEATATSEERRIPVLEDKTHKFKFEGGGKLVARFAVSVPVTSGNRLTCVEACVLLE